MTTRTGKTVCLGLVIAVLLGVVLLTACGGGSTSGTSGDVALGKTVYTKGTDQQGKEITRTTDVGVLGKDGCVTCHGDDAKGKSVDTSLGKFDAPDIRWSVISKPIPNDEGSTDPGYDEATFAKAVRDGVDSAGGQLEAGMPKWQLTDPEVNGLIAYLKTL